jgi:tartrate-resistant acid phosphatase type 5
MIKQLIKTFTFYTIGDWGAIHSEELDVLKCVARQMHEHSFKTKPTFVCALGDNFYDKGINSEYSPRWVHNFYNIFIDPYPRFQNLPWYAILGNHDYFGGYTSVNSEIAHTKLSLNWCMPKHNYDFNEPTTRSYYIYIDTCQIYRELYNETELMITKEDEHNTLLWLEKRLIEARENNANWIFVFGHYHIFSNGLYSNYDVMIERILPLLTKYNVDIYFSGHEHNFQVLKYKNTHFIVNGAGAFSYDVSQQNINENVETKYVSSSNGFSIHTVTDTTCTIEFKNIWGETEYTQIMTKVLKESS